MYYAEISPPFYQFLSQKFGKFEGGGKVVVVNIE